jgi:hypothetical protein
VRSATDEAHAVDPPPPVLAYATPVARRGIPRWVKEVWSFFKLASLVTITGAFLLALRFDQGHVSGYESTRGFMAFYLTLLAIGIVTRCLRAPFVPRRWRVSTALAVPFVLWQAGAAYVQLAYMRDGWPWVNIYPDARGPLAGTAAGLVWLAVSLAGFYASGRRGRAAALSRTAAPRPAPG